MKLDQLYITISLSLCVVLFSCQSKEYKYSEEILRYLLQEHNLKAKFLQDQSLLILDVEGCACSEEILPLLLANEKRKDNMLILIVGNNDKYQSNIERLNQVYKVYTDYSSKIKFYSTGLSKPLLLTINGNKVYLKLYVSDDKVDELSKYILTL